MNLTQVVMSICEIVVNTILKEGVNVYIIIAPIIDFPLLVAGCNAIPFIWGIARHFANYASRFIGGHFCNDSHTSCIIWAYIITDNQ